MERLKFLRKEKGFTQEKTANFLKISRVAYNTYELGTRQPDPQMLLKIADYFNVSVDYLLGRTDVKTPINELIVPKSIENLPLSFNGGTDNLTQDDIDSINDYIEYIKNKKKGK